MPNPFGIPVNLTNAVKRHTVDLSLRIGELERPRALRRKADFLKWNQHDPVLGSVIITELEVPFRELRIPPNAVLKYGLPAAAGTAMIRQVRYTYGL